MIIKPLGGCVQQTHSSFQNSDGLVEQFVESLPEDSHVLVDEIGPVEVALLDHEHQRQVLLHDPQGHDLVLLLVLQLHVRLALAVVVPVLVVEVGDIDEDVQDVGTDVVLALVGQLLVVVADVQLGDQVEQVGLLDLGVVGEVVEQLADIGGAGDHPLENLAEGLEDGGIVDGGKEELDLLDIDLVLCYPALQFDVILVPRLGLVEVNICLVGEDEDGAIVGVLLLEVGVDIVEVIHGLHDVGLRTEHVDHGCGVAEDHLLAGRRIVDVVLGGKVVQFELYLLDLEVIGLHFTGLPQQLGRLRYHLLEDHLSDTTTTRFGVAHQQYIHRYYNTRHELNPLQLYSTMMINSDTKWCALCDVNPSYQPHS